LFIPKKGFSEPEAFFHKILINNPIINYKINQMKKVISILSLFLVIFAMASCKYSTIVPDVPNPDVPVSYSAEIQPIFDQNCVKCHKTGSTMPDLTAANSYKSLMDNQMVIAGDAANSILYTEVIGGMQAYCDATSAGKIKNWINQGAKNN
jgi:hypothetical protein